LDACLNDADDKIAVHVMDCPFVPSCIKERKVVPTEQKSSSSSKLELLLRPSKTTTNKSTNDNSDMKNNSTEPQEPQQQELSQEEKDEDENSIIASINDNDNNKNNDNNKKETKFSKALTTPEQSKDVLSKLKGLEHTNSGSLSKGHSNSLDSNNEGYESASKEGSESLLRGEVEAESTSSKDSRTSKKKASKSNQIEIDSKSNDPNTTSALVVPSATSFTSLTTIDFFTANNQVVNSCCNLEPLQKVFWMGNIDTNSKNKEKKSSVYSDDTTYSSRSNSTNFSKKTKHRYCYFSNYHF